MSCLSVEMSVQPPTVERQPHEVSPLHPCPECGAPMLLMAATQARNYPITVRKTYQCMVCESVEVVVAPLFE
jgi:hypothetical protein